MKTIKNSARYLWLRDCMWTVKELCSTFQVPKAIARVYFQDGPPDLSEQDCFNIAAESKMLRLQIGA